MNVFRSLLILIAVCVFLNVSYSQNEKLHVGYYVKGIWLEKNSNRKQLVFKQGIEDGKYIITKKKWGQGDTVMIGFINNGLLDGMLTRWNAKEHYIEEECEYKDGKMEGIRKLYFKGKDGVIYVNIYRYVENMLYEEIQVEW